MGLPSRAEAASAALVHLSRLIGVQPGDRLDLRQRRLVRQTLDLLFGEDPRSCSFPQFLQGLARTGGHPVRRGRQPPPRHPHRANRRAGHGRAASVVLARVRCVRPGTWRTPQLGRKPRTGHPHQPTERHDGFRAAAVVHEWHAPRLPGDPGVESRRCGAGPRRARPGVSGASRLGSRLSGRGEEVTMPTLFGRSRRLSAAKIRARAKRAALAASRPDAKLHPVQPELCVG